MNKEIWSVEKNINMFQSEIIEYATSIKKNKLELFEKGEIKKYNLKQILKDIKLIIDKTNEITYSHFKQIINSINENECGANLLIENLRKKTTKIKAEIEDKFIEKSTIFFYLAEIEQNSEDDEDEESEESFFNYVFSRVFRMIDDVIKLVELKYKEMLHIYLIYS